jgi:hypothetical protein
MAVENAEARTQEQEQEEHRMRAMLYQALDNKQRNQYEVWRGSSVKDSNVKRVSFLPPENILLQSTLSKRFFFFFLGFQCDCLPVGPGNGHTRSKGRRGGKGCPSNEDIEE